MSKFFKTGLAATAMFAALGSAAVPMTASAMPQANGVTNCDAPGGRQRAGALIGAVVGGVVGDAVFDNTAGTIGGAAAGALIGNEVGKKQR